MKNISGKTLIFYTFQDRKHKEHNVTTFKKSAPQDPKIRDVLYELPLDYTKNSYHFRFKSEFFEGDEKIIGWIDISNLLAKVPIINNTIFVKILTLPHDQHNKLFNRDKLKAIGLIDPTAKVQSSGQQKKPIKVEQKRQHSEGQINGNKQHNDMGDLLNFPQKPKIVEKSISTAKTEVKTTKTQGHTKKPMADLIEPDQVPNKRVVPEETPAQRLAGFQDACNQQAQERQNERIAEKQFEQKLLDWGYSGHKTINNLTTLLATLHLIWPEWQPVSLTSMLNQDDVNVLFKKAVIKVHPDKNRRKDFRTKFLAKRVFELLNEAKKAQQS